MNRGKSGTIWSLQELTGCLRERQLNRFDANFGVSGARGDGKSTFLFKIFNSFHKHGFRQKKQQVYSQNAVKDLLSNQKYGFCWDDEAINSGYKRDFQKSGQIELIKIVTNYRDNFNVYGSALPFFYSLDKALRELIFMHVHIIRRGLGVILLPLEGQIHSQDPWDTITNKKIEAKENARLERNPNSKFRYYRFTTFAGFIYFSPMTTKQEKLYQKIKEKKRSEAFKDFESSREISLMERLYKLLIDGKLSKEGIMQAALVDDKKYSATLGQLNTMLKDNGNPKSVMELVKKPLLEKSSKSDPAISNLVPET